MAQSPRNEAGSYDAMWVGMWSESDRKADAEALHRLSKEAEKAMKPSYLAVTLQVVGIPVMVLSAVAMFLNVEDAHTVQLGLGGLIGGLLFVALGAIVDRLHKIEQHTRPKDDR